jgi:uncharacterized protein YjdB
MQPRGSPRVIGRSARISVLNRLAGKAPPYLALAILAGVAGVLACGKESSTTGPGNGSATVSTIAVSPAADTLLALGATQQYGAVAKDARGTTLSKTFTWTSSSENIATVNSGGLVTAVGNGSATITAAADGVSGTASAVVIQTVATVDVAPTPIALAPAETVQLAASAMDARSNVVAGATLAWESSNEAVAIVDATGLVSAVAPGTVTITASSGSIDGGATVTVLVAELLRMRALLQDDLMYAVLDRVDQTVGDAVRAALDDIEQAMAEGDDAALAAALTAARVAAQSGGGTDAVLLGVADLVLSHCQTVLDAYMNP